MLPLVAALEQLLQAVSGDRIRHDRSRAQRQAEADAVAACLEVLLLLVLAAWRATSSATIVKSNRIASGTGDWQRVWMERAAASGSKSEALTFVFFCVRFNRRCRSLLHKCARKISANKNHIKAGDKACWMKRNGM